ncbi:integral peroxisomal membrane peroxin-domain-containing protein [Phanerochaete sordida]|uniref:Integral peroxisomal membrane peroxin-domain-containing protein n=1 Tax=Phanerochaete sordida TaxID=48140 RepID=A0A9P3GJL1_9APHY|nr:integral peroxisomal membrane peroxin-domain-containing protein [Phanerochaete sordida]
MSKLVQEPPRPPVSGTITQFLTTLPSPLTISLVSLAPQIRFVRWVLETLNWKGSWDESWLLLAAWWGVCLGSEAVLRYLLPVFTVVAWWWITRRAARRAAQAQPATEDTLHRTVSDLSTIHELWISLPILYPSNALNPVSSQAKASDASVPFVPLYTTLRVLAFVYPPYLLITLTSFVRMRTLLGIAGTLVILHRAPFAILIRRALWRSAYIRWGVYWTWAKVSGTPLPATTRPPQSDVSISVTAATNKAPGTADEKQPNTPVNAIRFLFTVYENQRWWMGLDWTAALLPGERPSWCSRSLQPCAPPAAFSLPPPTTVYIPEPDARKGKAPDAPRRWTKRTATWWWEEPEWKVVVRKEGAGAATRVERPLPAPAEDASGAGASATKILRAAGKFRGASLDLSPERRARELDAAQPAKEAGTPDGEKDEARAGEEPYSDADGWVYADNKWEGGSAKGGMGKYTRFRRWTRVAVLSETVEAVADADVPADAKAGSRLPAPAPALVHSASAPAPAPAAHDTLPAPVRRGSGDAGGAPTYAANITAEPTSPTGAAGAAGPAPAADEGSRLRQRLKAVVNSVGH